jgi:hypothetical protein
MEQYLMKTDDLIALLASDTLPPRGRPQWQVFSAIGTAVLLAFFGVWSMGINPQWTERMASPSIAIKFMWLSVVLVTAFIGVRKLSRPGLRLGGLVWLWPFAWLIMAMIGVAETLMAGSELNHSVITTLWLGSSWQTCSLSIAALSLPVLAALLWALKDMAPTQPTFAGGVAGLVAGSLAAILYSLHCTETGFGFFTLWYGAGVAAACFIGAAWGRRWLRW